MTDTPPRLWLIRHGNRADFVDPTWLETAERPHDPPLSEDGVVQAQETGRWLAANAQVERLFASPFIRAAQTANVIAGEIGLPIDVEPGLAELLVHKWFPDGCGLQSSSVLKRDYPHINASHQSTTTANWPEDDHAIQQRVQSVLGLAESTQGELALVSHGGFISAFVRAVAGQAVHACPCCLVCMERSADGWQVLADGCDTSHLSADPGDVRLH